MAGQMGRVKEFNPQEENITAYLERLQLYFECNGVEEAKRVPALLTLVGAKVYGTLRSLVAPNLPKEKDYDSLADVLKQHFDPKPLVIAERFRFYKCVQSSTESIAEFVADLRRLSIHCEFGTFLNEALRDRFVCGVEDQHIQKKLLVEDGLTMARALGIAQGMEAAAKNSKELHQDSAQQLVVTLQELRDLDIRIHPRRSLAIAADTITRKRIASSERPLYRYNRLPFGVASAPAVFQKTMDTILRGLKGVICYIDDILITGVTETEHLEHLEQVLHRLREHGTRLKKEKCYFMQQSVQYLGHRIDAEGLHATDDKLKAITKAPPPKNVTELRSFLGLINYYGRFIQNLSSLLHPLNNLLCQWKWSQECAEVFHLAKEKIVSPNVLVHYDPSLPIRLAGDASAYGVGAVISHVMKDGQERPIAFASRTLLPSERNYAQVEKEALSLIFGVSKFHLYLYGRHFTLITDHKPLTTILGPKKGIPPMAAARLQRWAVCLSAYSYDIQFKPTAAHSNADGLSRLPLHTVRANGPLPDPSIFNVQQLGSLPVTAMQLAATTRTDPILSRVYCYTQKGWPDKVGEEFKPFSTRKQELTVQNGCLL